MRVAFLAVPVAFAFASCTSVLPHPTVQDETWAAHEWPTVTLADLTHGGDLYGAKCGGCHALYAPTDYPSSRWPRLVDAMVARAHVMEGERDLIVHYVVTMSRSASGAR